MSDDIWPEPASVGPLEGLRIVDLSSQLPGPYATALLADLGASVVKVEPPAGDVARRVDPAMYDRLNRRKAVIRLDLKSVEGRARLHALVAEAAVVLEAWRPGVAERLAADPAFLAAINPNLLYCSLTGYGQDGPLAGRGAHDLNIQAAAGALDPAVDADRVGVAWVDLATGQAAALALAAHWHAGNSGVIDVAMLDVARAWTTVKPSAVVDREPAYGVVTTADGARFVVAVLEDEVWVRLCTAFGWSDWAVDPDLADPAGRRAAFAPIRSRLDAAVGALDRETLERVAADADLPFTVIAPADPAVATQLAVRERAGRLDHLPEPVPWALISPNTTVRRTP